MGQGRLNGVRRLTQYDALPRCAGTAALIAPNARRARASPASAEHCVDLSYSRMPRSRITSESVPMPIPSLVVFALNLEVLGRGLATVGYLFVFHRLPFVERGQASF